MPVDVTRRCRGPLHGPEGAMLSSDKFRTLKLTTDSKGKKHRIRDAYCEECAARLGPQRLRRGEGRIPDR